MRCEHGYPLNKLTNKCMCKQMIYWKGYDLNSSDLNSSEGILTVEAVRAAAETVPLPDSRCYCSQLLLLSHSYLF